MARRLGLHYVQQEDLTWRRLRRGKGFSYVREDGAAIRDRATVRRLAALAVPPAYEDVRYAPDSAQPTCRPSAAMPQGVCDIVIIRIGRRCARPARCAGWSGSRAGCPASAAASCSISPRAEPTREFAYAAVIESIARSAIRPGNENYARLHRTHGATTLLKSHVTIEADTLTLAFRAKGNKKVQKEVDARRLAEALAVLRARPPAAACFNISMMAASCVRCAQARSTASCAIWPG